MKIKPGDVSDWMYAIEGRAYGAFTVNVMRQHMGDSLSQAVQENPEMLHQTDDRH